MLNYFPENDGEYDLLRQDAATFFEILEKAVNDALFQTQKDLFKEKTIDEIIDVVFHPKDDEEFIADEKEEELEEFIADEKDFFNYVLNLFEYHWERNKKNLQKEI